MILDFLKIEKNSSKEFWLSHLLVITATVIAVYLAAISGFTQAIKFENTISNKNSYYLQTSMRDELLDNIAYIDDIGNKYLNKYVLFGKKEELSIDNFVWDAMKFSAETFEIKGEVLTSIRRYYSQANVMLHKITTKRVNAMDKKLVQSVLKMGADIKKNLVPKINTNLQILKEKAESQGITL